LLGATFSTDEEMDTGDLSPFLFVCDLLLPHSKIKYTSYKALIQFDTNQRKIVTFVRLSCEFLG